jgi:hypothetical protein
MMHSPDQVITPDLTLNDAVQLLSKLEKHPDYDHRPLVDSGSGQNGNVIRNA